MPHGLGLCGATLQNMLTEESDRLQVAKPAIQREIRKRPVNPS
jgi:hypothetical protein